MDLLSPRRLAATVAAAGAVLLGCAVGGVAAMDADLVAAATARAPAPVDDCRGI